MATKETLTKEAADLKKSSDELKTKLAEINPGFEPATIDTIKKSMKDGPFDFLIPEVDESSKKNMFSDFAGKLDKQSENWKTMETADQTEADKGGDTAEAYKNKVKADKSATKTITDFSTALATFVKEWDGDTLTDDQKKTFAIKLDTYKLEAIKANIGQAIALQVIDKDNKADYEKYVTELKKRAGFYTDEVGKKIASKGGDFMNFVIGGAVVLFAAVGGYFGYQKCSASKKE